MNVEWMIAGPSGCADARLLRL